MMAKPIFKLLCLISMYPLALLFLNIFNMIVTAQEHPGCFIINSSGEVNSLNALCRRNNQYNLRTVMDAQKLYKQGRQRAKKRLYKEAVEDFTQAININPNFAEAYIARAYTRSELGDDQGGIKDFQKAVDIYRSSGDSEKANVVLDILQQLQKHIQMEEKKETEVDEGI